MNRKERRKRQKMGLPVVNEPVYNLKDSDIRSMRKQANDKAADNAFVLMLAIPVMVIHDKFDLLIEEKVDGKSREERFADMCIDLYDSFDRGYISFDDLHKILWDEAGIRIEKK